jgi:hypothetical protein
MFPQAPRLSPEYSHKAGLQTVITGKPLQIRPVMRGGHAGPVTMGRITRGPPCLTRPRDRMTSSWAFVQRRVGRRVSLPVVLSSLVQRGWRRHRAKGGVFAFAPTTGFLATSSTSTATTTCLFTRSAARREPSDSSAARSQGGIRSSHSQQYCARIKTHLLRDILPLKHFYIHYHFLFNKEQ